jgi:3-oxoacyl-[acyl-carrier protein] reductase
MTTKDERDRRSRLEGQVALVTGSARGIGAAIAERLASDGAAVAINYTTSAKEAEALVEQIRSAGGRARALQADVSSAVEARALVETTFREFGRIDILVNNAATATGHAPLDAVHEALVLTNFALNVGGPIFATQAAVARFPEKRGRVINVSSLTATRMFAGASVYAATKSALEALTRVWAAEFGSKGITVNAVAPGPIDTDMFRRAVQSEEARQHIIARTPLGRIGTPSDVADVVAFLASDDARWLTGQVIETSGGMNP